nr:hypothetical protein [Nostoc sp. ChiQUE02]MDZ8233486.1 hypothetical protein [Nostoc sp. ChiQUE02]
MGGTDLLAIAICAEKSRHPFSPLRRIDKQLSNICHLHILKLQHHAATLTTLAQRNNCIAHLFF